MEYIMKEGKSLLGANGARVKLFTESPNEMSCG